VSGSIDNIDLHACIKHGRVFRKNRDSALALQIARVHDAFGHSLVVSEGATLAKHGVNERGLAVIHVRNNGDVANTRIQIENSSELQIYGLLLLYYGG
jgi:hypothetical protein